MSPESDPALIDPRRESSSTGFLSLGDTRCFRRILAFSSSVRSSRGLVRSTPLPGVSGRIAEIAPNEGLWTPDGPLDADARIACCLGVPIGVERLGMLGGGGVPVY